MILGLESNFTFWQFLLLFFIFIVVLALAYYLVSHLLRQETPKTSRNWNIVGILALLLPPIIGLGGLLGVAMFSFFVHQLHGVRGTVQERVFVRELVPKERYLRMALVGSDSEEGLEQLQGFLLELEQRERDWHNPELWKAYNLWNRDYLSLLYIGGRYQEMVSWLNARIKRFPDLAAFPAYMSVATEALGNDGAFWREYIEASNLDDPAIGFMRGFFARNYGRPDSALIYLDLEEDISPVDYAAISNLGERIRALADLGDYDQARELVIQRLEPLLEQSDYPILEAYVNTTRCYVEMHYYMALNDRALYTVDMLEERLLQAVESNPESPEGWILLGLYYSLNYDNARASYYFNDIKARSPWVVPATIRFFQKVKETGRLRSGNIHYFILENIELGLKGELARTQ